MFFIGTWMCVRWTGIDSYIYAGRRWGEGVGATSSATVVQSFHRGYVPEEDIMFHSRITTLMRLIYR